MTAVFRRESGNKPRPPPRHETVTRVGSAEAGEACVHDPQFIARPGDFVDADLSSHDGVSRQEAGVMSPGRLQLPRDVWLVVELPDVQLRADCESTAIERKSHRRVEIAEV